MKLVGGGSVIIWATPSIKQTRAKPGAALGTALSFSDSLTNSVIIFLPQLYGAATPKRWEKALHVIKYYVIVIKKFQSLEGRQIHISGSEVKAILLKG